MLFLIDNVIRDFQISGQSGGHKHTEVADSVGNPITYSCVFLPCTIFCQKAHSRTLQLSSSSLHDLNMVSHNHLYCIKGQNLLQPEVQHGHAPFVCVTSCDHVCMQTTKTFTVFKEIDTQELESYNVYTVSL